MSLQKTVTAMAGSATDEKVGLVIRWSQDDAKIKTIWSEASGTGVGTGNPTIQDRPAMFRQEVDDVNQWRATSPANDAAGYHAEELMIACWSRLLVQISLQQAGLSIVEMVLSKSCCYGEKGSSPLRLVNQQVGKTYGASCSQKLYTFISELPKKIKWHICYITIAGARAGRYDRIGYGGHRGLMTSEELELDMWRQLHVWYRDEIKPDMTSFADFWAHLSDLSEQQLKPLTEKMKGIRLIEKEKPGTISPEIKRTLGRRIGALSKETSGYKNYSDKLKKEIKDKIKNFRKRGRLSSLYTAQRGIDLLQSLVNVDVSRWNLNDPPVTE